MASPGETRKAVGILLALFACALPAMFVSGFFGTKVGRWSVWLPIAAGGGAVGGLLCVDKLRDWYVGIVAGAVAGAGGLLVMAWWASWRSSLYSLEILAVAMVGAIPGLIVGYLLSAAAERWRQDGA